MNRSQCGVEMLYPVHELSKAFKSLFPEYKRLYGTIKQIIVSY